MVIVKNEKDKYKVTNTSPYLLSGNRINEQIFIFLL